ncbi:TPA: polyphosphate kinase 1 [Streptococcus suis]
MSKLPKTNKSIKSALSKGRYFNRELSWLFFNQRVIEESYDANNPLLEQLRFLAIAASNADEFFMVRVAGVYEQYMSKIKYAETKTYLTPLAQLKAIRKKQAKNIALQYQRYHQLVDQLGQYGYQFKQMHALNSQELVQAQHHFTHFILPTLSPLGLDKYRPFPHLNNKAINLYVRLQNQSGKTLTAIIPIPHLVDRYLTLANGSKTTLILTEDLIIYFIDQLFTGYEVLFSLPFRITRDADFEIQGEDASDLIALIEDTLKQRKNGAPVRLEVDTSLSQVYEPHHLDALMDSLKLEDFDLYQIAGPLDLTFLFKLVDQVASQHPQLAFSPFQAHLNPKHLGQSLYDQIKAGDILYYHPYDSFQPIVSLLETAAKDPATIAIKQTLYRVSKDSPIIAALKEAASQGIEVTVLVELKARFDEENNVYWAKELEEAGCHVLYGVSHLKTHSKICLIIRKEEGKIQPYVHLGTGNYNDKTAKIYTDFSLLTASPGMTQDATLFFNHLSGFTDKPTYSHFQVSPHDIKIFLSQAIDREINNHTAYGNGYILAKMNSLTDSDLIDKFYQASQAGVKIDLIVRGICCLRPGIPGLSDNIQVRSIVGRFLEHARAYYFYNNGAQDLHLSSADLMTRNMEKRIEIAFPIMDPSLKDRVMAILNGQLADTAKARILGPDGVYVRPTPDLSLNHSQQNLINQTKDTSKIQEPHLEAKQTWLQRWWKKLKG